MILNNTQANIFKVNGGIADNFANRPAASGSFYIFYSIDTQEIYYDNGAWVLLGSGGGGVNIYNSDGTLTGNRTLSGANNDLNFADLNVFKTSIGGNDIGLKLDFANNQYYFGNINTNYVIQLNANNGDFEVRTGIGNIFTSNGISGNFQIGNNALLASILIDCDNGAKKLQTFYNNANIGLKLDFANKIYAFGDYFNTNNSTKILIDDNTQYIQLQQSNNVAVNLQFTSRLYGFGQTQAGNQTYLQIDDSSQIIKAINQGNDIGLKLEFPQTKFSLGDFNNLYNGGALIVDSGAPEIYSDFNGQSGFLTYQYVFIAGDFNNLQNGTSLFINDNNQLFKTQYQGNDIGFKLDFANTIYSLGLFNAYGYSLDPFNGFLMGDINGTFLGNACYITINNQIIKTKGLIDQGFYLDFANKIYQLGQITGGNQTYLYINDASELLYTANNGTISNGLYCDFAAHVYQFGRANGGNTTYLTINDAAAYPVQLDGTNITAGTSGGVSGQHLKIKINGVDYKIELRNP